MGTMDGELLERQPALEALRAAAAQGTAGRGRLVLVAGEAGVGKTALVRRFCEQEGDLLWGSCDPLFTPRPLGPFIEIAAQVGGDLATAVETGSGPHGIVAALLASAAGIIVLEDLHWADEATLDVVRLLARRVAATAGLVIATYRDDELGRTHPLRLVLGEVATQPAVIRIRLAPLSPAAVAELAGPAGLDAARLYTQTSGNPFFLTQVLTNGDDAIPPTVTDAVLARVGRLSPPARALLDAVAIAPPRVEHWLLERLMDEDRGALEACRDSGTLTFGPTWVAFRHELARLAVVESLDPHRLRGLHRKALQALANPPDGERDVVRLAHHADAAGDAQAVIRYARAAADRATSLGAHREAAAYYARVLHQGDSRDLGGRAELLQRFASASYLTDRCEDAIEATKAAAALYRALGDRGNEADALVLLSSLQVCPLGAFAAEPAAQQAIEILEQLPPGRGLARAYANRATIRMNVEDAIGTQRWAARAIVLAGRFGDHETLVDVLNTVGTMDGLVGGLEECDLLEQSLQIGTDDGQLLRGYSHMVWVAWRHADYVVAERYAQLVLELCREPDYDLWRLQTAAYLAHLRLDRGQWDDALRWASIATADPRSSPLPRILGSVVLGLVRARRGENGANSLLAAAFELAGSSGELQRLAPAAAAVAEGAWLRGDAAAVDRATAGTLDLAAARGAEWIVGRLACWRDRAGLPVGKPEGTAEPYALELSGKYEQAADVWRDRGCPYEAAVVLGRADDEYAMRRAHDDLLGLGAFATAGALARMLRKRGVQTVRRGPRPSTRQNGAGLTARELQVLGLLAEGLSDLAIAERLYLSPRTVGHHVSSILRKLGVRTRSEAAAESARVGLGGDGLSDRSTDQAPAPR
jgi:DNA-binding CsgD family transcriptional regulator